MAFSVEGAQYSIRGTDTDWADRLQLSALFSLMQESALSNAETCGWGPDVLDPLGVRWVLLRVSVRMEDFPTWRDELYVETWPRGLERLLFLRDFTFWLPSGDGNRRVRIGGATSSWVLVDMHTRKLRRPDVVPSDPDRVRPDLCALLANAPSLPAWPGLCDKEPTIVKYADACDIDRNLHVNNTRYVAWSVDAVHRLVTDRPLLSGIDIQYISEARFGDKLAVYADAQPSEKGRVFHVEGCDAPTGRSVFRAILYEDAACGAGDL